MMDILCRLGCRLNKTISPSWRCRSTMSPYLSSAAYRLLSPNFRNLPQHKPTSKTSSVWPLSAIPHCTYLSVHWHDGPKQQQPEEDWKRDTAPTKIFLAILLIVRYWFNYPMTLAYMLPKKRQATTKGSSYVKQDRTEIQKLTGLTACSHQGRL
jgi:hypothetical protein